MRKRKAYKYRIYPDRQQVAALETQLETHRRLYNNALAERRDAWEQDKRTVRYPDQGKALTAARQTNPFLQGASVSALQRTLRRLDKAYANFFRRVRQGAEQAGYPRFVRYGEFRTVEYTYGDGIKLHPPAQDTARYGHLHVQHVPGLNKLRWERPVQGLIKAASFTREADGWYAVFSCDLGPIEITSADRPPVAVDLGLDMILATSDGEVFPAPRYYDKAQKKLARAQRRLARRQKGGKNREKARQLLARHHQHVANQRRDWHHKAARSLVDRYGLILHEDVRAGQVARVRGEVAKGAHDAAWGAFLLIAASKGQETGARLMTVQERTLPEPEVRCPHCARVVPPPEGLTVRWRVRRCPGCNRAIYPAPTVERAQAILRSAEQ